MRMLRTSARAAVANRGRFTLTGLSVMLSVAFVVATLVLSDSMRGRAADDVGRALAGVDAVVQGRVLAESDGGPGELGGFVRRDLPVDAVRVAESVDGVTGAVASWTGFAKLVVDGSSVGTGTASDVGRNWIDHPRLSSFGLAEGRAPQRVGEVVLDRKLARDARLVVGDRTSVLTATGVHEATVVGLASYAGRDAAPLQRTVLLPEAARVPWLAAGPADEVLVELAPGRSAEPVVAALRAALPDAEVSTGAAHVAAQQAAVTSPLQFLSVFLLSFAVIALLIGVTIIFNTFALTVARRRRESGLLRAIGAQRRQVLGGVVAEALVIGVVATSLGVVGGIAGVGVLRWMVGLTGVTFLNGPTIVSSTSLVVGVSSGLLTVLLAAWVPARRAAATAPVEAMRDATAESRRLSRTRTAVGLGLAVCSVTGGAAAVALDSSAWLGLVVLVVPALVLCGPALIRATATVSAPLLRRVAGPRGAIAAGNLGGSPRRASSTSLALTLGSALVVLFAIIASSLSSAVGTDVRDGLKADFVVTSATADYATIDPSLSGRLRERPELGAVASLTVAEGVIDSRPVAIGGIDPMRWPELFDLGPVAGDVADLRSGGIAVVSTDRSLLGTDVTVELERSTIDVPVVAVVARSTGGFDAPAYFVDRAVLDGVVDGLLDTHVYVRTSPGVGLAEARAALLEEVGRTPGSFLSSRQQHLDSMGSEVRAFASFIDAMLYLAMLIALLGVANTMALAVSERSNEIGLLRAVGATRSEVRRIVLLEAGLLSSVAAVCGTAVAVVGTWAFITVAGGSDIPTVIIPWPRISVTVLGSAVLGTLAAAWPAWRVSRRPALELVSSVR